VGERDQDDAPHLGSQGGIQEVLEPTRIGDGQEPLWAWCAVSYWLMQNNLLRPEESWNAEVVEAINNALESARQRQRYPELVSEVSRELGLP